MTNLAVEAQKKQTHTGNKTATVTFKEADIVDFNKMSLETKKEIAATFDCQEDLDLQDDLRDITGGRGLKYKDLIGEGKYVKQLKAKGICVKCLGKRMWEVSRVDEKGNVVTNGKGKLAQFKLKDFNSDSYIQNAEFEVNTLLKSAGYDCRADMKPANSVEKSSNNSGDSNFMDMFNAMNDSMNNTELNESDNRRLISKGEFNKKVKELKEKGMNEKEAIKKLKQKYRISGEINTGNAKQSNTSIMENSQPGLLEQYQ